MAFMQQFKPLSLKTVGSSIRKQREARNLKQDYVGRRVGRCISCISRLENGQRDISIKTLLKIADCLEVHPCIFFED